jgi:hypothetical protein
MCRILVLCGLLFTSACATITTGSNQALTVTSDPSGANCTLERGGETVGVVNPTPGSVTIPKSTRDLTIRCERQGYEPGVRTISSSFQVATLGNLILGGVVGLAVDAASGAVSSYEPNIQVSLIPGQLTGQARADWFDARRREITARYDERLAQVRGRCPGSRAQDANCVQAIAELQSQRDLDLSELERERRGSPAG